MTGDELLALVRAGPRDDQPRAVYADWLLEQGDGLGEFIALQLRAARGETTKPEQAREKVLLDQHWRRWCGGLAAALHRDRSTFERGFLATAVFPHASTPQHLLKKLVGEPHWATAHTVRCVHGNEHYVPTLLHPVMRHLERTSLDGNELVRCEKAPWRLRWLDLRAWALLPPVVEALGGLPALGSLRTLRLYTQELGPAANLPRPLLARLTEFELGLRSDPVATEVLTFLRVCPTPVSAIGTSVYTATARGRHVDFAMHHESEFAVSALSALLKGLVQRGFNGARLHWAPGASIMGNALTKARQAPGSLGLGLAARAGELSGLPVDTSDFTAGTNHRSRRVRPR